MGGRRFHNVYSQSPPNHVSYASFGFRSNKNETWLALITHVGLLTLYEMADPEALTSWAHIDQVCPFGQQHRGTEAKFTISFQQSIGPAANAVMAGLDPRTMSIAVSAMNLVKIYRIIPVQNSESEFRFCEVFMLPIEGTLINEIAWAPGCLRPYDTIAAACNDGTVRMLLLDTPYDVNRSAKDNRSVESQSDDYDSATPSGPSNALSGIGAGLAGLDQTKGLDQDALDSLRIQHVMSEVALLPHDEGSPVWRVRWMHDGKYQRHFVWSLKLTYSKVACWHRQATVESCIYGKKMLMVITLNLRRWTRVE